MDARNKNRLTAITVLVAVLAAIMVVVGSAPRADASPIQWLASPSYSTQTQTVDGLTLVSDREYTTGEVKALKAKTPSKLSKTTVAAAAAGAESWYLIQSYTAYRLSQPLESLSLYYNGNQFMGYERHESLSYGWSAPTIAQICSTYYAYGNCKPGMTRLNQGDFYYYAGPVYTPQYGGCEWLYGSIYWANTWYQHVIQGHCG